MNQTQAKSVSQHRSMAREPERASATVENVVTLKNPATVDALSKTARVVALLSQPFGVTIDSLITETGWLPHTTRAALTGLRKKGHRIISDKADGVRTYRIETGAA